MTRHRLLSRRRLAAIALCALLVPTGLRAEAAQTDRLVSIGGAVTEILYALGRQDRIVGVDTTSLFPEDALRSKPNVGYMRALSAEGVLSLRPSLVLAIEGSGPPDVLKQLGETGIPLVMVPDEQTPDGVLRKIRTIGKLVDAEPAADRLAEATAARFQAAAALRAKIAKPVRVLFVLALQNGRAMVGGRHSAADAMITLAGAVNAAGDMEGYKTLTDEAVIAAAPDIVLMMANGRPADPAEIFALPAFSTTPAAVHKALVAMDGLTLLGFGPRTPDTVRDLMAAFYPDIAFPKLEPGH